MAHQDGVKVGFHDIFPAESTVFEDIDEKSQSYPGKSKINYDSSQDGLKILLILLVVSLKRTQAEVKTFISTLSMATDVFGGAMYRLGGIIFGTQSNPVSGPSIPNGIPNLGKVVSPLHSIFQVILNLTHTSKYLNNGEHFKNSILKGGKGGLSNPVSLACCRLLFTFTLAKHILVAFQDRKALLKQAVVASVAGNNDATQNAVSSFCSMMKKMHIHYMPTYYQHFRFAGKSESTFRNIETLSNHLNPSFPP
jgi:hypothetical protein